MIRALLCGTLVAACGGGKAQPAEATQPGASTTIDNKQPESATAPSTTSASDVVAAMESFRTEACACTDEPCLQRVTDAMVTWSQDRAIAGAPPLSDQDSSRIAEIGEEMGACMAKVMDKGTKTP